MAKDNQTNIQELSAIETAVAEVESKLADAEKRLADALYAYGKGFGSRDKILENRTAAMNLRIEILEHNPEILALQKKSSNTPEIKKRIDALLEKINIAKDEQEIDGKLFDGTQQSYEYDNSKLVEANTAAFTTGKDVKKRKLFEELQKDVEAEKAALANVKQKPKIKFADDAKGEESSFNAKTYKDSGRREYKEPVEPSRSELAELKQKGRGAMKQAMSNPPKSALKSSGKLEDIKRSIIRKATVTRNKLAEIKASVQKRIPVGSNNIRAVDNSIKQLTDLFTKYNGKWDRVKQAMYGDKTEFKATWTADVKMMETLAPQIGVEYEKLIKLMHNLNIPADVEARFNKFQQFFLGDYKNIEKNLAEIHNSTWHKADHLITEVTALFNQYYEEKAAKGDASAVKDIAVNIKEKYQDLEALSKKAGFPANIQARFDKFIKTHESTYKVLDRDIPKQAVEATAHTTFRPMR